MTDINEENKDLIENKTPFGLLDEETQERMCAWPHGWQEWSRHSSGLALVGRSRSRRYRFNDLCNLWICVPRKARTRARPEPVEVLHEVSITVESPLLDKEMHFKLTFDAKLENPTIEEIK